MSAVEYVVVLGWSLVAFMCCKALHGASSAQGDFFWRKLRASSSQAAQEPIGISFAARFRLRTNLGKIMQAFSPGSRKIRARQPALDSRGELLHLTTPALNVQKASLAPLSQAGFVWICACISSSLCASLATAAIRQPSLI